MNRLTVRFGAAVLAVGVTFVELIGVAAIAETAPFSADSIVPLPRVVVTPDAAGDAPGETGGAQALMSGPLPRT
jgi:hypothetical protein